MMTTEKAVRLALEALRQKRQRLAAPASAARYGFRHGELAKARYDELAEAIEALEKLLKKPGE